MKSKIGYAFAFAVSMLGIIAAADPAPKNAKKGMKDPLKTSSTGTPNQLIAITNPSEKARPKKIVLPACENPKKTPVCLEPLTFYSIGSTSKLLNLLLICFMFF